MLRRILDDLQAAKHTPLCLLSESARRRKLNVHAFPALLDALRRSGFARGGCVAGARAALAASKDFSIDKMETAERLIRAWEDGEP